MATPTANPKDKGNPGNPKMETFFLIKAMDTDKHDVSTLNIFLVEKTMQSMVGNVKQVKFLRRDQRILVEVVTPQQVTNLLKLKEIGTTKIEVEAHPTLNITKGIIRDRARMLIDLTEEEILEGLAGHGVVAVKRFMSKRSGTLEKTNTYLLSFQRPSLPTNITACYYSFTVEKYYPNPLRCFKCQRFGHHSARCRAAPRCGRCGEADHEKDDCPNPEKCPNCQGDHSANAPFCPSWKLEKEALRMKIDQNMPIAEARKKLQLGKKQPSYAQVASSQKPLVEQLSELPYAEKKSLVEMLMKELKAERDLNRTPNNENGNDSAGNSTPAPAAQTSTSVQQTVTIPRHHSPDHNKDEEPCEKKTKRSGNNTQERVHQQNRGNHESSSRSGDRSRSPVRPPK